MVLGLALDPYSSPVKPKRPSAKWVIIFIHIHVIWVKATEGTNRRLLAKKMLEGVGASKEGGKGGMGVSMEGVVKRGSRWSHLRNAASLQAWREKKLGAVWLVSAPPSHLPLLSSSQFISLEKEANFNSHRKGWPNRVRKSLARLISTFLYA